MEFLYDSTESVLNKCRPWIQMYMWCNHPIKKQWLQIRAAFEAQRLFSSKYGNHNFVEIGPEVNRLLQFQLIVYGLTLYNVMPSFT